VRADHARLVAILLALARSNRLKDANAHDLFHRGR
jgi:hypothetical protein